MTRAYPLQWPAGYPRTAIPTRSRFDISPGQALNRLMREIALLHAKHFVVSTNIPLRRDGMPYASHQDKEPADKGAAVYFMSQSGQQMCFACDKWDRVHDNIHAIAKTIDALRGIDRWGSGNMVNQAFSGFALLEAPQKLWWHVLNVSNHASEAEITEAFRRLAKERHPDAGGSLDAFNELVAAKTEGLKRCA